MDEGFASVDAAFDEQAQSRINEFISRPEIVIMASHSMGTMRRYCEWGVCLCAGAVLSEGPIDFVIDKYESDLSSKERK